MTIHYLLDPDTREIYPILQSSLTIEYSSKTEKFIAGRKSKIDRKSNIYIAIIITVVIAVVVLSTIAICYNWRRNYSIQQLASYPVEPLRSPTLSAHGVLVRSQDYSKP